MADHPRTTGREKLDTTNPHVVGKLITEFAWSPIVWTGGVRKAERFAAALWCVLDFDDGDYTLSQALDEVTDAGLCHVLGTTKSHGVPKDGAPACDRFRLLLRFPEAITDRGTFERAMRKAMELFPHADKACKDAARFYFPCRDIVSAAAGYPLVLEHGEPELEAGPEPPPAPCAPPPRRPPQRSNRPLRDYEFDEIERNGIHEQRFGKSRHEQLLEQTRKIRWRYGFDQQQCFEYLRCRFPADRPDDEIWRSIKGAWDKGLGQRKSPR